MLRQLTDHSLLSFLCRAQLAASTHLSSCASNGFQSCYSTCSDPASAGLIQVPEPNCIVGGLWQNQQQLQIEQQQDRAYREPPPQHPHHQSATSQSSVQSVQLHSVLTRCGAQQLQCGAAVVQWAHLCNTKHSSSRLLSTASHLRCHCFSTLQPEHLNDGLAQPQLGMLCAASAFDKQQQQRQNRPTWSRLLKSYATQRSTSGQQPNPITNSNSSRGKDNGKRAARAQSTPPDAPATQQQQQQQQSRVNQQIRAAELMVVFPDGTKQVLGRAAARAAAEGLGLDLVEVNARSSPPVARILDYKRLQYEQKQKLEAAEKQRRLQQKMSTPKEMQFSARIADHDLEVKMRKVAEWLEQGYRVQMVVKHKNEEQQAAADALSYLTTRLQSDFSVDVGPQQPQRRALTALVKPTQQTGKQ